MSCLWSLTSRVYANIHSPMPILIVAIGGLLDLDAIPSREEDHQARWLAIAAASLLFNTRRKDLSVRIQDSWESVRMRAWGDLARSGSRNHGSNHG